MKFGQQGHNLHHLLLDSHESEGGGEGGDDQGGRGDDQGGCGKDDHGEEANDGEPKAKEDDQPATKESTEEYNPLIVRRSQRAIKPTKDIDLYLLGAKFGVDVEGSDADSSDLEFAPETASDGK